MLPYTRLLSRFAWFHVLPCLYQGSHIKIDTVDTRQLLETIKQAHFFILIQSQQHRVNRFLKTKHVLYLHLQQEAWHFVSLQSALHGKMSSFGRQISVM